jgi:hypothetical protein
MSYPGWFDQKSEKWGAEGQSPLATPLLKRIEQH